MTTKTATTNVEISASPAQVWGALTEPEKVREWLWGADVETTWDPGTEIVWRGEHDQERYEDRGEVLEVVPEERLAFTHYSPHSGKTDRPENYARVTFDLGDEGERTGVTLTIDNPPGDDDVDEAKRNWREVLDLLKRYVERG